ncbi:UDP-3-O-acyl-N-acetylglucosamine deacetylase [Pseudoroseomonas cervicalis]|uniref:UDP-3-O-acyl-N-acetylglucosamine deacetylase n=1 Tax=Teichococcus cervicalis TaxID=204525 RepID=UPI002787CC7C|nr:UDP-3-O-acyl-N-acetylglucosamine deacetylase [Pseudoroseomonas cervicalis]MDQ1079901.1 hypothetical protein [Pseudoroseomonas cervicalis]
MRHKLLDVVGDLALAGAPLSARFSGSRSGHALNNRLLRALFADATAWRWQEEALLSLAVPVAAALATPVPATPAPAAAQAPAPAQRAAEPVAA